jgi:hypothetical protein
MKRVADVRQSTSSPSLNLINAFFLSFFLSEVFGAMYCYLIIAHDISIPGCVGVLAFGASIIVHTLISLEQCVGV